MRKRHYLLLFLCGFLFYHCYDSHHIGEPIKQESDDSPIMNEAKSILSGCDNSVVLTNLKGNEHSRIESRGFGSPTTGTPIWEKAVELQNGDEEVLLVPLQEEQTRYTHTCIVRGNVDSRQIASSFSQLMIKKKNNRTIAHVITYLPERKYLRKNSSLSDSLIYNPTRFNFEGIVLISSLKGTFKHGYLYEKGIPVIKLFKRHEHTDNCSHHSHEAEVRENVNFNIFFYTKSLQSRSYGTNEETELFCSTCFKPVDECTCYLIEGEYIYCNVCGERSYECVCDLYRCDFCGKYPCVCGEAPELCPACLNYPCTCYDDEECMYCGKNPCECSTQYCNVCYREKSNCACCPDCHKYPCECEDDCNAPKCEICGKYIMDNIETRSTITCPICESRECPICGDRHCDMIHSSCDSIPNANTLKNKAVNSFKCLRDSPKNIYNSFSFDSLINVIDENRFNENAASVSYYADSDTYSFQYLIKGDKPYSVYIETGPYTHSTIHSHPNNTPPSGLDLINTAKWASECNNYQYSYIYTNGIIYALYVEDAAKARSFYLANKDKASAAGSTTMFVENTDLAESWDNAYGCLNDLTKNEKHMMALAEVMRKHDSGMQLLKWNYGDRNGLESEPEFGIYTTRSYNNEKLIIPLKCE